MWGWDPDVKLRQVRSSARRRGIPCSLTVADLLALSMPVTCPVLGLPLVYSGRLQDRTATIDRVDSSRGYEAGNVRVISWRANRLKGDGTEEELWLIARAQPGAGAE